MSTQSQPIDPATTSQAQSRIVGVRKRAIHRFFRRQSASGILLLAAAALAFLWANSPWSDAYETIWNLPVHAGAAGRTVDVTLQFIVNDVLMAIFFLEVGLEIRREIHSGELSTARRAALPCVAALGGMLVPAAIYLVMNGGALARGWAVPMSTDIAFAVGVLTLFGSRVARSMRVFLLALAIIDDIGAILVIALFYSGDIAIDGCALVAAGIVAITVLQRLGARHPLAYAIPATVIWLGLYRTGVHPAIAGVIVGFMTPAGPGKASPLERVQRAIHPWIALGIMPLFAFANAGIALGGVDLAGAPTVAVGIVVGLAIGKPLGILLATRLAVRLRIGALSPDLTWRHVAVVATVAGVGFTMALFVAELAFLDQAEVRQTAKLAVLMSSMLAIGATYLLGRRLLGDERHRARFLPWLYRGPWSYALVVVGSVGTILELADAERVYGRLLLFTLALVVGLLGLSRTPGGRPPTATGVRSV